VVEAATLRPAPDPDDDRRDGAGRGAARHVATGAGAEARQQIGWVIVGGLMVGTLFTLYIIPTALRAARKAVWASRGRGRPCSRKGALRARGVERNGTAAAGRRQTALVTGPRRASAGDRRWPLAEEGARVIASDLADLRSFYNRRSTAARREGDP
jgi:hypothetical protein